METSPDRATKGGLKFGAEFQGLKDSNEIPQCAVPGRVAWRGRSSRSPFFFPPQIVLRSSRPSPGRVAGSIACLSRVGANAEEVPAGLDCARRSQFPKCPLPEDLTPNI